MIKQIKYNQNAQSAIEYVLVFAVVLAALVSTKFIKNTRCGFENHFNKSVSEMYTPQEYDNR